MSLEFAFFILIVIPASILVPLISWVVGFYIKRRKILSNIIISEYLPPPNISPPELGYLYDTRVGSKEIIACLLDLENRSVIKLEKYKDQIILKINKTGKFRPYESFLISEFSNKPIENLSFHSLEFSRLLRQELISNGYLHSNFFITVLKKTRTFVLIISVPFILFISYAFYNSGTPIYIIPFVAIFIGIAFSPYFFLTGFIANILSIKIVGHNWLKTEKLDKIWPEIEGYKKYVEVVEIERLKFKNHQDKENAINIVQAYAVALGLDTDWKSRFIT